MSLLRENGAKDSLQYKFPGATSVSDFGISCSHSVTEGCHLLKAAAKTEGSI